MRDLSLVEFIDQAVPEVAPGELSGWSEDTRDVDDVQIVMVRLDSVVADMAFDEFCTAVNNSGESSVFATLVEVYPLTDSTDSLYRITGSRVDNAPRYYVDSITAVAVLHGRYSTDNWVLALYDDGLFDESTHAYLDPYNLFQTRRKEGLEWKENRSDEIRRGNSIIDWIHSDEFTELMEKVGELTEEERRRFFDDL